MIWSILKSIFAFTISFLILSISFNGKTLFSHIYRFTGPLGQEIKETISNGASRTFDRTKDYSKELFLSSEPKGDVNALKNKRAEILKQKILRDKRKRDMLVREEITHEDTQKLNLLIEKSR